MIDKKNKFPLLSEYLSDFKNNSTESKIKYQKYIIEVSSKDVEISIPVRETDNFENDLNGFAQLHERDLTNLLRKFRGIKKIG